MNESASSRRPGVPALRMQLAAIDTGHQKVKGGGEQELTKAVFHEGAQDQSVFWAHAVERQSISRDVSLSQAVAP